MKQDTSHHSESPADRIASRIRSMGAWLRSGGAIDCHRRATVPRRLPRLRQADRGVSEVLGFILLFGVLILGVTMIQLYGVPATNERLEFEHSQGALGDVAGVNDLFGQVTATGQPGSATIEAGMTYPSRLFLFNPAPVSGALRTTNRGMVTVENAVVPGTQPDDVRDYWNGTNHSFETSSLAYSASYNLYDFAPTRSIEHGLVYDRFPDGGMLTRNRAPLIEGNRISIVTLDSNIDTATAGSIIVESALRSGAGDTVTITNSPGKDLRLRLPTGLTRQEMETALAHEHPNGNVIKVLPDDAPGYLTVVLEPRTYELSMSNIKVGSQESGTQAAHYLVPVTSGPATVQEGSSTPLTVQVRDRLNNPVSGVTVEANASLSGATLEPLSAESDEEGLVRFVYAAQNQVTGSIQLADEVRFTLDHRSSLGAGFDPRTVENAALTVLVQNSDRSGVANPGGEPGAGYGGISYWDDTNDNETFAVPNGKWLNINNTTSIKLSDGEMVTRQVCQSGGQGESDPFAECRIVDELHLGFTIWDGDAYGVDVHLRDANRDGEFRYNYSKEKGEKVDWSDIQRLTVTNETGSMIFQGELNDDAINRTLVDPPGSGMDILDDANYGPISPGDQNDLNKLKMLNASWFTGTMHGRVLVTISKT